MLALSLTASPRLFAAEPAAEAQAARLFDAGQARFREGRYEAALELFRQALGVVPHDAVWFNVAVCLERLGRPGEAYEAYRNAAESPTLSEAARTRARAAADRLSPPAAPPPPLDTPPARMPLPAPRPEPPTPTPLLPPAPAPSATPPWLGPVGWTGALLGTAGLVSASTAWILGTRNLRAFDEAADSEDWDRALTLADRADRFDLWYKLSLASLALGAAAVVADRLWLGAASNDKLAWDPRGVGLRF